MKIILASGSPRRYDLLRQMGWDVKVHSLPFAEVETINDAKAQFENLRKQFLLKGHGSHIFSEKDLALQRLKIAMEQAQSLINMELYAIRLAYKVMGEDDVPADVRKITIRNIDQNIPKEKLQETAINNLFGELKNNGFTEKIMVCLYIQDSEK